MSSVDTFEPCPQCGADAYSTFQTRTCEVELLCLRCGYREDNFSGLAPRVGVGTLELHGTGVVTTTTFLELTDDVTLLRTQVAADPSVTRALLRLPPLFRAELICGRLENDHNLSEEELATLQAALAPFGERVVAIEQTEVFTCHATQPGYRRFHCWRNGPWLELSRPGDVLPFLTIGGGWADVTPTAAQEVHLG